MKRPKLKTWKSTGKAWLTYGASIAVNVQGASYRDVMLTLQYGRSTRRIALVWRRL